MAVEIDADLAKNYRALREQRGLSWDQLAAQTGPNDRRLAAWMREQAATEDGNDRSGEPRGRTRTRHSDA